MYHGWTSTPQLDKERWELIKRHNLEAKRDAELAKLYAHYDSLRVGGELPTQQDADLFFAKEVIVEEYEIGMAELEAQRLAQVIAPQFAGQLRDGLPEKVIPYDRKSDIAYSVERELRYSHAGECPAARDDDAPEHELSCTCGGQR